MKSAVFYTLGCKLNQCETEALSEAFIREGFHVAPLSFPPEGRPPEFCIINTCTVTSKSEQKARKIIRKVAREMGGTTLIITGCYAELNGQELENLGVDCIIIPQEKKQLLLQLPGYLHRINPSIHSHFSQLDLVHRAFSELEALEGGAKKASPFDYNPEEYPFHSRPFLKIQDGCDNRCAYCRVPLARGNSLSLPFPRLIERVRDLENRGVSEVVLTGVNISSYHWGELGFLGMLSSLLKETRNIRFRLSSLEPENITPEFSEIAGHPRVRPHFHLPIQSGSDRVLISMGRKYTRSDLKWIVDTLRKGGRDPFIGADFIVGFPGEGEEDFQLTLSLAEELTLSRIHQFSFSSRPGTRAEEMEDQVPARIISKRKARLKVLNKKLEIAYRKRCKNREVEAIIEIPSKTALTENYLHVNLSGKAIKGGANAISRRGGQIRCRIVSTGNPPLAEVKGDKQP